MTSLSSSSHHLKVVLALVVLFLGWLIASMIPRSETPWDRTSSSFLARRPVTDANGEPVDEEAAYRRLWSGEKANWDPEKKNVTIEYDDQFFGQNTETETAAEDGEKEMTAEPSDTQPSEERARQWGDEIKVESDTVPEIKVEDRPKWDDDSVFDTHAADAEELAPPMGLFDAGWDSRPDPESAPAETAPEVSADTGNSAQSDPADPVGESPAAEDPLIARTDSSADGAAQAAPDDANSTPEESESVAAVGPMPTAVDTDTMVSSNADVDSGSGDSGLIDLPTKRPAEQESGTSVLAASGGTAPSSETQATPPLPMKTLTPSGGSRVETVEPASSAADEGLISQVSATLPDAAASRTTTSAYYQETAPAQTSVPAVASAPSQPAASGPTAIALYTAGPGENWDGIAAKFGLSDAEVARYYEVNSFRINEDRTVTEGMKLMLPKR